MIMSQAHVLKFVEIKKLPSAGQPCRGYMLCVTRSSNYLGTMHFVK